MLSLDRCREILGEGFDLSDAELEGLRNQLYSLANLAIDAAEEDCASPFRSTLKLLTTEHREALEERAAIREFEGEMTREEAEQLTLRDHSQKGRG